MAEEQTSAPAGVDTAVDNRIADTTAAAALLDTISEKEEQKPTTEAPSEPAQEAEPVEETQEAAAEEAPQETDTEDPAREAEAETEPSAHDLQKLHGNAKIRLRDGTEWTVGELKRRIADVTEADKITARIAQERQQFEAAKQQTAQQAQLFAQLAPQAMAAIQASLPQVPPLPPQELANTDPFAFQEKLAQHLVAKQAYDQKVAQMRQIQQVAYQQQIQKQQAEAAALANTVKGERTKLLEKFPEFADSEKVKTFQTDFLNFGRKYGFNDQELTNVYDHRLVGVMRDAIAYRKLMDNKPKPTVGAKKPAAAPAPQAQQPGRRASNAETSAAQRQGLIQSAPKVGKSGDLRDVGMLLDKLGL